MLSIEVQIAISWWWSERKQKGANWNVTSLVPFLYTILDAFFLETRKLPLKPMKGGATGITNTPDGFNIGLWLKPEDYSTLRVILALIGDLNGVLGKIKTLQGLLELGQYISPMAKEIEKYVDARNFFTHMDDVWRDLQEHGIDGPQTIAGAMEFTSNAKNRVYLVMQGSTIFYSYKKRPLQLSLEREQFDRIFVLASQLFAEIMNSKLAKQDTGITPIDQVYPLS